MHDYGVTKQGFSLKRLDVIMEELHDKLSDPETGIGFNTRHNPDSFLNVLLTNLSDKYAELWEVGRPARLRLQAAWRGCCITAL